MASPYDQNIKVTSTAIAIAYVIFRLKLIFHPAPITPYDFWIYIFLAITLRFGLLRYQVFASVPSDYSFPDAKPEMYPQLDRATFDRYATELEGLGFEKVMDFSLVGSYGVRIPSFCRLYIHPREMMYSELAQLFPSGRAMPVLCTIQTYFNDDWSLGTGSNQPQPASIFIRNPHAIGRAMPGKSPWELLQAHREWRDQMIQDLGVQPEPASLEGYRAQQKLRAEQRAALVAKGSFLMKLGTFYKRKALPIYDWKGDWPSAAAKRRQKGF
jgi:hypothetical protein